MTGNGLGAPFRKQFNPEIEQKQSNLNKNNQRENEFCSNIDFSLNIRITVNKSHATKPLNFSLHFLFQRD